MATAALQQQITRLEQMVQTQQSTIESLQQGRDFFATDLGKQIDQQIENAQRMRGTIGSEYLNITRFISKQIAHGMTRLQEHMGTLVATSLPVTVIQDLEKKYLAKPAATLDLEALTNRILLLETALATKQEVAAIAATQVPAVNQEELEIIKQHVHHLETQMIQEVQRAHKTIHKPGEYAAPLQKLQTQVDMLRQELASIKSVDGQAFAQSLLTNTVSSLRSDLEQQIATKATEQELAKFQSDISRIEKFSREVQTGFYEMRAKHERLMEETSHRFSAESLAAVEFRLKSSSEKSVAEAIKEQRLALQDQQERLEETNSRLLESGRRLEMEVWSKYGPDMLERYIREIRDTLSGESTEFQERLEKQTTQGLSIMNLEIDALRRQQKEFTAKVSSELDSSTLRQKYAEFSAELEKQTEFFGTLKKSLETVKAEQKSVLVQLETQFSDYKHQVQNSELEIAGIKKSVQDAKQSLKAELATWLAAKQESLQGQFSDAEDRIQQMRDSILLLQSNMTSQIQEYKQKEKDKYAELQKSLWAKFEMWLVDRNEYLAQRVLEMSKHIQSLVAQANKREDELSILFSEKTLRDFVTECERRLRSSQESWMARRSEELQLKYSEIDRSNSSMAAHVLELQQQIGTIDEQTHKRQDEMAALYGETSLRRFVSECEKRIGVIQEDWMARRAHELQLKYSAVDSRVADLGNQLQSAVEKSAKRDEELAQLYSESKLRKIIEECEKRLTLLQEIWLRRRQEEIQSKYSELHATIALFKLLMAEAEAREARITTKYGSLMNMKISEIKTLLGAQNLALNKKARMYAGLTKCFYTAIFATDGQSTDTLAPISNKIPGWRYICFTNMNISNSNGWQIVHIQNSVDDSRLEAKKYKWLSHKYLGDFDVAVWVDAYMAPNPMFSELLKKWILEMTEQQKYIAHRPHEIRDCVYEECEAVVEYKRETAARAEAARNLLQAAKVPEHGGLFDTNIIVRFHKQPVIQEISEKIYEYLKTITYRDQLIAPLVYHKENFTLFQTYQLLRAFNKTGEHVRNLVQ